MLIGLTVPPDNQRGPQYAEQFLAALHQANARFLPVELLLGSHRGEVLLGMRFPTELHAVAESQLAAHYPDCAILRLPDDALSPPPHSSSWRLTLALRPHIFPIRRYPQFDDPVLRTSADPLAALLALIQTDPGDRLHTTISIIAIPARSRVVRTAEATLSTLASPFFRTHPRFGQTFALARTHPSLSVRLAARGLALLSPRLSRIRDSATLTLSSARSHDREDDLQAAADKLARHLFEVRLTLVVSAPAELAHRAHHRLLHVAGAFGQFTVPRMASFRPSSIRPLRPSSRSARARPFLLSCEELATLWHPPTATVRTPRLAVTQSRELPPPAVLPTPATHSGLALLGRTACRFHPALFGIRADDRLRHLAVIGKTGMGKSTLLTHLIVSDVAAGRGLALIDPHGDLAETVIRHIPLARTNDVVLFDAADHQFPLAYNPLTAQDPHDRGLTASAAVAAFKKLFGESWGPRLEYILRNALLALLEVPGTSLLSLQRMLGDAAYRRSLTDRVRDPVVRAFWTTEFLSWKPQYQAEAVAPILNKVGQFLSLPILRAILGQHRNRLDLRAVMDEGRVLIVNLSKGRMGEDASAFLGSLLVSGLQLAAMRRAEVPEHQRRDFFLYVDEFQNFATDAFATILSEARKYHLALTVANQYLAQMDEGTMHAVFGNVGSLLVFQVGPSDAEPLALQLGGDLTPRDLLALPRYTAYARLLIDGMPSPPFSMTTIPPPTDRRGVQDPATVREVSRRRYARPSHHVQAQIAAAFPTA